MTTALRGDAGKIGNVYRHRTLSFQQTYCGGIKRTMHAPNVLMIGTGEYTTGFVHGEASRSDKSAGVVALTVFDLKQQGRIGHGRNEG